MRNDIKSEFNLPKLVTLEVLGLLTHESSARNKKDEFSKPPTTTMLEGEEEIFKLSQSQYI